VKRTPYSTTAPGSPTQSVTTRPAVAMESIPWAMTSGSPTDRATRSFQWMTLKSPDAPAYITRLTRCRGKVCDGSWVPTSTSAKVTVTSGLRSAGDDRRERGHDRLAVLGRDK